MKHNTWICLIAVLVLSGNLSAAEPERVNVFTSGDGAYHISGTKIFISAGDNDFSENVIHLVLAKLPDAPPGAKGISMFLVPKFMPTDEGKKHGQRARSLSIST